MRKLVAISCSLCLLAVSPAPAVAWGDDGHQTVGRIASLRVKPHTAWRIARILKPGETLANISTWADSVKERMGTTDPDPDTNAFLQDIAHNEKNREWHYDDLPLGCTSYQTCNGFTPDNDVIHMINICIRTLQGRPNPNQPLSERNALRLLVHFIGDMHQPLHIGSGYIDAHGPNSTILLATNPAVIRRRNLPNDRGGNQLIIDNDRKRLHGYWDFDLVRSLMTVTNKPTSDALGSFLRQTVPAAATWNPHGPINSWAAQWATDSLNQSRANAYRSIRIVRQRTVPVLRDGEPLIRNGQPVMETIYDITRPAKYETLNRAVVRRQLAKAGFRLAKLLDAIYAD
jgi:S1/P1 Nuclease